MIEFTPEEQDTILRFLDYVQEQQKRAIDKLSSYKGTNAEKLVERNLVYYTCNEGFLRYCRWIISHRKPQRRKRRGLA